MLGTRPRAPRGYEVPWILCSTVPCIIDANQFQTYSQVTALRWYVAMGSLNPELRRQVINIYKGAQSVYSKPFHSSC